MYEIPIIRSAINNEIVVSQPVSPPNPVTYLTSSVNAGATSISVLDNSGFVNGQYVLIGLLGTDQTEVATINGAVTPGGSLSVAALTYSHSVDSQVQVTNWNEIIISGAATATGSKTVIATVSIQPGRSETVYTNTGTTYAYYFAQFKNASTAAVSSYSDSAPANDYATTTVRRVKDEALAMTSQKIGSYITDYFLNNEIFNCEQEVWFEVKSWGWAKKIDVILGQTAVGSCSVLIPTNMADPYSNSCVFAVRIGYMDNLQYIDKSEFDVNYIDVQHTTLAIATASSDTTITVVSANDFYQPSGSLTIGTYSFAYSSVSGNVFTLTSGTVGVVIAAGTDVWGDLDTFGQPNQYTIDSGLVKFNCPISNDADYVGKNVYMSYYSTPTAISTDDATLNLPDFSIYHYYLGWKILLRNNNGSETEEGQAMYAQYKTRKDNLKRRNRTGNYTQMVPRLNRIDGVGQDTNYTNVSPNYN